MDFSIIIINYKTKELTAACLDSIFFNFLGDFEVIVVDNASNDGSIDFLSSRFGDRLKLIASQKNLGFSGANNLAAKAAKHEALFFLNSDTLIKGDELSVLADALSQKNVGIVGPKLILENGDDQPFSFGSFPNFFDLFFRSAKPPKGEIDWVSGAALAIRTELFWKIGGFDEDYFMYFEDMDLCRRVKSNGMKVVRESSISVVHLVNGSPSNARKDNYYKSQNIFFRKHYGLPSLLVLKIFRWVYLMFKR